MAKFDLKGMLSERSAQEIDLPEQKTVYRDPEDLIPSKDNFYSTEDTEKLKQSIRALGMQDVARYTLDGAPITFPENGGFYPEIAQLVVGDFGQAVYSIRQDVTVKILDQGVIQDPATKEIVYNLAQQDMTALRIVFRMGWALPNPATRMNEDRTGCAFAYLEPGTPVVTQKVTFTVTDGKESSPVAYEGVRINVDGAILVTGDDGKAEFNLRAGTYTAKITKKGYISVTETFTVAKAAVTKNITLTSRE